MRREAAGWMVEADASGMDVPLFSILVPAYRTDPKFLKELVESVQAQVYPKWELIILDASEEDGVKNSIYEICGEIKARLVMADGSEAVRKAEGTDGENAERETKGTDGGEAGHETYGTVRYVRLAENAGISENTNAGIPYATGDYVGLLDHDDVLTPDSLYEMASAILSAGSGDPMMVYSDEDKWDGEGRYYEPNRKEDFNLDLLLSNNYVCHFLVMKAELFRELKLRREYDGAQDYDLVLRAAAKVVAKENRAEAVGGEDAVTEQRQILHVPKVLYHWRCHGGSTAENPQSKLYAYEAGRRALQDFADRQGWQAKAEDLKHLGFYRLCFGGAERTLEERVDLGAIGGKILTDGKISGGRMAADGGVYYEGLRAEFSGYLNRAVLTQDAEAVDLRCIHVAKEYWPLFQTIVGVPYVARTLPGKSAENGEKGAESVAADIFDVKTLPENADVKALSLQFCKALREQGKRILWDPQLILTTDVT